MVFVAMRLQPVERFAGEREVGLADGLGERRVRMDQPSHVLRHGLPVVDQHAFRN